MTYEIILDWLQASLRWSAPLIICAMGEIFAERSGIINMGIEGIMLCGALCGVAVSYYAQSQAVALFACAILGLVLGLIVAFLTVSRRTNQVVTGLMINLLAIGATNVIFSVLTVMRHKRATTFGALFPESMHRIPLVGPVLFAQPFTTWIAIFIAFIASFVLYKTRWGLNVRAVGDNPQATATAGLSVIKLKYQTLILSSIAASVAGGILTLASSGYFAAGGMTGGRGFIVLAAVVVGGWDPMRTMFACMLFGATDAAQLRLQTTESIIPTQFLQMLPYVITVVALTIMVKRSRVPKTWGAAYDGRRS
ncbi:MAG: ABC transporter permease [Spirochaetae bacterium HGW-Spirochaetae-2]|nr:MAG: ABC transporter permease [Spirochaetae bacterium HGW-Spirochaetae-2]